MRNYDPVFYTIVVGSRLYYASSSDDSVHCLDCRNGHELWHFTTGAPLHTPPSYDHGNIYFGSDAGTVYCVKAENGDLVWKRELAENAGTVFENGRLISFQPCRTGVLVEDGTAYCTASLLPWKKSRLCALDAASASEKGDGHYIREVDSSTLEAPLLATARRLVVLRGRSAPLLFERKTGKPLGPAGKKGGCVALITPDERLFYGPGPKKAQIAASKAMNGGAAKLATYAGARAMVAAGNMSYVVTDKDVRAIKRDSGKVLWHRKGVYPYGLILAGDTLFAGGRDEVAAFSVLDGSKLWHTSVTGRAHGLTVANGALYVSTDSGDIICFRPGAAGKESARKILVRQDDEAPADVPAGPAPEIPDFHADGLIGRWVFQNNAISQDVLRDLAGNNSIKLGDKPRFVSAGKLQAMKFDNGGLMLTDNITAAKLPKREITAEAWVRIDKLIKWGGIVGAIQDNGSYERGWILGYDTGAFYFAVAGNKGSRLTYLKAAEKLNPGEWHHVVGTYDGSRMCIYVDGKLVGENGTQKGDIKYPPKAFFEIGAYRDKDENYPMNGAIQEIRLYQRPLSAAEVALHWQEKCELLPQSSADVLTTGPWLQFIDQQSARVFWRTDKALQFALELKDSRGNRRTIKESRAAGVHALTLENLMLNERYEYRLKNMVSGIVNGPFECDTTFNYSYPKPEKAVPIVSDVSQRVADTVLRRSGKDRGIAIVLGCRFPDVALQLARSSSLRVLMFDSDSARVDAVRERLFLQGQYGAMINAHSVASLSKLPVPAAAIDLVVNLAGDVNRDEVARILAPGGVGIMNVGNLSDIERGKKFKGAGVWTHMYGMPDNSAYGGEHLSKARCTSEMEVAWLGKPGPRYQVDRQGRGPGPLAANGRLFGQGMDRILALNSYNGTILWSLEIPGLARYNVPHDCSNWCCDDNAVFAVLHNNCMRIDAADGSVDRLYSPPKVDGLTYKTEWGYVARVGDLLLGSNVRKGAAYRGYWGAKYWYDAASGVLTANVCSDQLFACNVTDGKLTWKYHNGVIINSTLTESGGRLYFLECRNAKIKAAQSRRIQMPELWQDIFLVALDTHNGRSVWERKIQIKPAVAVCYMACAQNRIVVVSSNAGMYYIYAYDTADGNNCWQQQIGWGRGKKSNHGSHLSRPVIVNGTLYVAPGIFDLKSGERKELKMPVANCGSYSAAADSIIFRVKPVTRMWNLADGELSGWTLLRPNCWISTIPANGMILSLEGGGGCSCGGWIESSFGFMPRSAEQ